MSTLHDGLFAHQIGLFTWWPWFVSPIDTNDPYPLPSQTTIDEFVCSGGNNHPSITGNRLNVVYLSGTETTLKKNKSPYYVTSNVVIQSNATVNIENGVEIIFVGDYTITVRGTIDGCYDADTSGTDTRGLYLVTNTYIHSNDSTQRGGFYFDYDDHYPTGYFCNTLFETMTTVFELDDVDNMDFLVDNCEIKDVDYVISGDGSSSTVIKDSIMHDFNAAVGYDEDVRFDNCLFYDFQDSIARYTYRRFYIYNSEIIGDGTQTCITGDSVSELKNTIVDNCNIGIVLQSFYGDIKYNNFTDCRIGIKYQYGNNDDGVISYNNFINTLDGDNNTHILYGADDDFEYGKYNYWGYRTNNQSIIASTIKDICDGYSSGLFRFWPWSYHPIGTDNIIDLAFTFDFDNCDSINDEDSYFVDVTTSIPTTTEDYDNTNVGNTDSNGGGATTTMDTDSSDSGAMTTVISPDSDNTNSRMNYGQFVVNSLLVAAIIVAKAIDC